MTSIPPYQSIDLLLGKAVCTIPPVPGYVITAPDSNVGARLFLSKDEADTGLAEMKAASKWPHAVQLHEAWIHEQDVAFGRISNRTHWTPR